MTVFPTNLLPLSKIRTDGGTQPRVSLDRAVVEEYAEVLRAVRPDQAETLFPPLLVFHDGNQFWLTDGFHRLAAAKEAGLSRIAVKVRQGHLSQAQWHSFSANQGHGLRRSNEDKRRAVLGALAHEEGCKLSDERIAAHCGVAKTFVQKLRHEAGVTDHNGQSPSRLGKDGRTYHIENIQAANKKRMTTTTPSTMPLTQGEETLGEEDFIEEHEEPKTPVSLEDGLGRPVPEALAPAFRCVPPAFAAVRNKIIAARTEWNSLARALEDHGWVRWHKGFSHVETLIDKLRLLIQDLQQGPFSPCVYCGATEPGESPSVCEGCRGSSWMSKEEYERAPQALREKAA